VTKKIEKKTEIERNIKETKESEHRLEKHRRTKQKQLMTVSKKTIVPCILIYVNLT
jgi:hypothetical protein